MSNLINTPNIHTLSDDWNGKQHMNCSHCGGIFDVIIKYDNESENKQTFDLNCMFCKEILHTINFKGNVTFEFITKPTSHNTYWTLEDEYKLCNEIINGKTLEELSNLFNRTPKAVSRKMEKMANLLLDKYRKEPKLKNSHKSEKIEGECSVLLNISLCDINKITEFSQENHEFVTNVIKRIMNTRKEITLNTYSKKGIKWLNDIIKKEKINIQHAQNGGEYIIPNTLYKADGYCKETNTIYEFLGCIYHGCNKCYDPNTINPISSISNKDVYKKTIDRENNLKKHGYKIISIWEHDYK